MSPAHFPDPTQFRLPAVRHLAWICHAPQLFSASLRFKPSAQLPSDTLTKLQHWDEHPGDGPSLLTEVAHPRLGFYFERLYECLMTEILGWKVLARNLQIKSEARTLGELDFVLQNPRSGAIEHHEIAVKFYLGYPAPETGTTRWYGPNAKDRLDLKTQRLLEHQSQRTQLAETGAALKLLGIQHPLRSRIFMPGYLFYPHESDLAPPGQAPDDHARGQWLYLDDAREINTQAWVQLRKPHWLGPWRQTDPPDPPDTELTLEKVQSTGTPRLFASLERDQQTGVWKEKQRYFVVPAHWPAC